MRQEAMASDGLKLTGSTPSAGFPVSPTAALP